MRSVADEMSDHCLLEATVRVNSGFKKRRHDMGGRRVVKMSKLGKEACGKKY